MYVGGKMFGGFLTGGFGSSVRKTDDSQYEVPDRPTANEVYQSVIELEAGELRVTNIIQYLEERAALYVTAANVALAEDVDGEEWADKMLERAANDLSYVSWLASFEPRP